LQKSGIFLKPNLGLVRGKAGALVMLSRNSEAIGCVKKQKQWDVLKKKQKQ
jgi:hypothetical protein